MTCKVAVTLTGEGIETPTEEFLKAFCNYVIETAKIEPSQFVSVDVRKFNE